MVSAAANDEVSSDNNVPCPVDDAVSEDEDQQTDDDEWSSGDKQATVDWIQTQEPQQHTTHPVPTTFVRQPTTLLNTNERYN